MIHILFFKEPMCGRRATLITKQHDNICTVSFSSCLCPRFFPGKRSTFEKNFFSWLVVILVGHYEKATHRMADGGRQQQREIVAGFEIALANCVYYCLHHSYPLHHTSAFYQEYVRDWSINSFAAWAGNILDGFIVYGQAPASSERRIVVSRNGPTDTRRKQIESLTDNRLFHTVRRLFLQCLDIDSFHTPLSSMLLKSELTVYQEVGFGTCWLAACLNLILHIPETRVMLWNAINRKIPSMDDATLLFFVQTPVGRNIFKEYERINFRRMGKYPETLTSMSASAHGGSSTDLIQGMQIVIPELKVLRRIPEDVSNEFRSFKCLQRARDALDKETATEFLELCAQDFYQKQIGGAILRGQRVGAKGGHAVAVSSEPCDKSFFRTRILIHNHGVSGREMTLLHFLKDHPVELRLYCYKLKSAKRHLYF